MNINTKPGKAATVPGNKTNYFAGGKNISFDVWDYKPNNLNVQRCAGCQTDDLKHAVKNSGGLFCRRCEQRVEHIRRVRPDIIAAAQREAAL